MMVGYRPYPEYKDSGVEWLEQVPKHWSVSKTKLHFDIQLGKMLQPEPCSINDEEVVYLKAGNVQWGRVELNDLPTMWASPQEREKFRVESGDLLVCEGGEVGRSALLIGISRECIIQNALHRIRPLDHTCTKYLNYLMRHLADADWFSILCNKATIAHLTGDKLGALAFPMPSFTEQQTIARFLDHKTAQIDALIAKKEELLEKLAEKRTALISHAVTKGLDPNVKMKDSEVEWLGEVPAHWEAAPLRHFMTEPLSNGLFKKREYWGDGIKIVNVFDVYTKGDVVNESSLERVACDNSELEKYSLRHGDFVFVRSSLKLDGIGKSASVLNPVEPLVFECHLVRGRPDTRKVDPKFLCYVLNSNYSRESLVSLSNQVTMATLDQQKFKRLVVTVPPILEQQAITNFLNLKIAQIDEQVNKVIDALEKLKEYRSALITQAVTGKIDVRNIEVPGGIVKRQVA